MSKLKSNSGSVLVTTVMISIVLSILVSGLFTFLSFLSSNEANASEVDRSFWAAESGLLMGSRWIRGNSEFPTKFSSVVPFNDMEINNMLVRVTLTETTGSSGEPAVLVTSEVYDTARGATVGTTSFERRLSQMISPSEYGVYATFFDDVEGWNPGSNSGWGGFYRREFVGRFHMNEAIKISYGPSTSNRTIFRDGKVSVASSSGWDYGNGQHDNNVYNKGVRLGYTNYDSLSRIKQLDSIFTTEYEQDADKIEIPIGLTAEIMGSGDHDIISLPASQDDGEDYNDYRPSLEFFKDGGTYKARYHYREGGTYKTKTYSDYDDKVFIADAHLNILGVVDGQTTVATTHGHSVMPVDDIVYSDYNESNGTVPTNSKNALGIVSGKRIHFNDKWVKRWEHTGTTTPTINGGNGTLDLTGSLIAVETNKNWGYYDSRGRWRSLKMGGEYWDRRRTMNYNFNLKGNHIMKSWHYPKSGSKGAQGYLKFDHDLRLINKVSPPGYPSVKTSDGLLVLNVFDWQESHSY